MSLESHFDVPCLAHAFMFIRIVELAMMQVECLLIGRHSAFTCRGPYGLFSYKSGCTRTLSSFSFCDSQTGSPL